MDPNFSPPSEPRSSQIQNLCFYSFNYQDALSHLRLVGPASHLGLNVIHGIENGKVFVERAQLGDVIIMQRDFPRDIEAYLAIQEIATHRHIPLILDIDDLLFELPEGHPDRTRHTFSATLLPTYLALLQADLVTVTTPQLQGYLIDFNKNVLVLPNFLDDRLWQLKTPLQNTHPDPKIVIGYMGGHTHQPDLAIILPVVNELLHRYPQKVEFVFWGAQPPEEISGYPNVHWRDQITWNYQDFTRYFQSQTADIFIAPLADNLFNRCKSSIKYLEYGTLGVAGVYSNVGPYSAVIRNGVNGFLASTQGDWLDSLVRLIEDPALRKIIAVNALEEIRANWLLSEHAPLWLSGYQKARETLPTQPIATQQQLKMLRNLSQQIVAMNQYSQDLLKQKTDMIIRLEDQVAQRDATIEGITNSRTWKLALSLRRIRELIAPPKR